MSALVATPLLVALAAVILTLLTRPDDILQRTVSPLGGVACPVIVAALFGAVILPLGDESITLACQVSNWTMPFGITLITDALSVFPLALTDFMSLLTLNYSIASISSFSQRLGYYTLFHFMVVGITGLLLANDILDLFVWFEVILMSSYVLMLLCSGREYAHTMLNYAVFNPVENTVMLIAISGLYSTTGMFNVADIVRRLAGLAAYDIGPLPTLDLSAVLLSIFALKTGLASFRSWVLTAYRAAPSPMTAMLAGVAKKIGIYVIIRLYFTIFATVSTDIGFLSITGESFLDFLGPVILVMAAVSIVFGGIGVVGRGDVDDILAYSSISQAGFIVLLLAVTAAVSSEAIRVPDVTTALVCAFNHNLTKNLLFLTSDTLKDAVGSNHLSDPGGLADRAPVLAAGSLLGTLTLIGVSPLSGFFRKYLVFQAAAESFTMGEAGVGLALAVVLAGAILTIVYYTRAWDAVFWGRLSNLVDAVPLECWSIDSGDVAMTDGGDDGLERLEFITQVTIVVTLAIAAIDFGIGFGTLFGAVDTTVCAVVDMSGYVGAVLHGPGIDFESGKGGH